MSVVAIGCHGLNGHQILGLAPKLANATIVGMSGVSKAEYGSVLKEYPHVTDTMKWYPDLDALLRRDDIDMVSICSRRRDYQAEDIIKALDLGKHVYAEKPLVTTLADLGRLRKALENSGKELRAMTGNSYSPLCAAMREIVGSGEIGEVVQVYAQKSYPYHDKRPQDRGIDGGLIMQAGIHAISFIRWVTGLGITSVCAFDTMLGNPRPGRLQMAAALSFTLSNGGVGVANFNYLNPGRLKWWGDDRLRIYGTAGMVESAEGGTRAFVTTNRADTRELTVPQENSAAHLQAFIDLLAQGMPMRVSREDSLIDTLVVLAAQASASCDGRRVILEATTYR